LFDYGAGNGVCGFSTFHGFVPKTKELHLNYFAYDPNPARIAHLLESHSGFSKSVELPHTHSAHATTDWSTYLGFANFCGTYSGILLNFSYVLHHLNKQDVVEISKLFRLLVENRGQKPILVLFQDSYQHGFSTMVYSQIYTELLKNGFENRIPGRMKYKKIDFSGIKLLDKRVMSSYKQNFSLFYYNK
jgi:hypothetical protein